MLPTRLDLATLAAAYRNGLKPSELFAHLHALAAADTHHAWISLLPEAELLARARALETRTRPACPFMACPSR